LSNECILNEINIHPKNLNMNLNKNWILNGIPSLSIAIIINNRINVFVSFPSREILTIRYTILAPTAVPKGFVDAKQATEKVIDAIQLDSNDFRYGFTKASNLSFDLSDYFFIPLSFSCLDLNSSKACFRV
jgi:hypothetical protein